MRRHVRAVESTVTASIYRDVETVGGMTDTVVSNEDTIENVQTTEIVGSG